VLERIAEADTADKLERLLPWNVDLATGSDDTTPSRRVKTVDSGALTVRQH